MSASTPADRSGLAKVGLVIGSLILIGGLFGVWLQGPFYEAWDFLIENDLVIAFALPSATVVCGCMVLAPVILCSPLTSGWTPGCRTAVYMELVLGVLVCIAVLARIAAGVVGKTALY